MVIPAAAGLVQHQSEIIRQRVSVAAGGDITAIKILQGHLGTKPKQVVSKPVPLTLEQKEALIASAQSIDDEKLRAAIVALGEAVLTAESETSEGEAPPPLPF